MKLLWDPTRHRFILECEYKEADIARSAGFVFDKQCKVWWADDPILVAGLRGTPGLNTTPETKAVLDVAMSNVQGFIADSRALVSDFNVPKPEGIDKLTGKPFEYLPFQRAGVEFILKIFMENHRSVILADQMGI